ncbi:AzlD domain-containing protein [Amorphus orientalis]|uniref:Branched-subunit amino acid transport protein n=1 Tax=Amorphus orientalis TaxID=649198 RepID=A0AAE3VSR0_9HYPH|nr:AzlD domain-containing protein [Amorphus orientalis]MDQ0317125.1 branched-subunit amino acid transport protein [Amorphus orientalis]
MSGATELDFAGLGPFLTILIIAALPTHIWRWLGVLFAGRLTEESEIFIWVKAVAIALLAALISQLILFPNGALADVPMLVRVAGAAIGLAVYFATRRTLVLGLLAGEAIIAAGWFLR